MACEISAQHLLLLLLLSLSQLLPFSSPTPHDDEFKRWVSWNVENYRQRTIPTQPNTVMGSHRTIPTQPNTVMGSPRSVDLKLAKAETAAVRYIVSQDGSGDFESVREAVESISLPNKRRVVLEIRPGIYSEKIVIPKTAPFITFLGSPDSLTTITGNDTAATKGADGRPMSTFHSSTVAVNANYFIAANIKFENSAGIGGQAVAVRISGDKAAFYNCSFYGAQDTLYDHKGLHYFNNCFIQGSVDFIFGNGRSLYEDCYLNSIAKNKASMTAQRRSNTTIESGFSFTKSTVSGSGLVYLGRPWGDRSRVVFSYTFMDKVVIPQGWNNWHIQRPEESGVYYGEYMCSGPGANWTGRVQWARQLTDEEAQPFLGIYYVYGDSWILGPPSL